MWTSFGHHLDIIWTSCGYHMGIIWLYLDIVWPLVGHHLGIIWVSFGHHLDIIVDAPICTRNPKTWFCSFIFRPGVSQQCREVQNYKFVMLYLRALLLASALLVTPVSTSQILEEKLLGRLCRPGVLKLAPKCLSHLHFPTLPLFHATEDRSVAS